MKALRNIGIIVVVLLATFFVIGLFLPKDYHASRSVKIKAPAAAAFTHIENVEHMTSWSPWKQQDPTIKHTHSDERVGVGAWYKWASENSGAGTYTVTKVVPNERLDFALNFDEQGEAEGYFTLAEDAGTTEVTWGFQGHADDISHRYFGVLMDTFMGPSFELGLTTLKTRVEKAHAAASAGAANEPPVPPEGG